MRYAESVLVMRKSPREFPRSLSVKKGPREPQRSLNMALNWMKMKNGQKWNMTEASRGIPANPAKEKKKT